jgi:hypothetical protein
MDALYVGGEVDAAAEQVGTFASGKQHSETFWKPDHSSDL